MRLSELHEQDNEPAWYVVREGDDAIAAGPYDSEKEARRDMGYKAWYRRSGEESMDLHQLHADPSALTQKERKDRHTYYIEYGVIDETSENSFDTFKPVKRPRTPSED